MSTFPLQVMHRMKFPPFLPQKKSSFLLESNEMPNEDGRFAIEFVRLFKGDAAQAFQSKSHSNLRTKYLFLMICP